MNRVSKPLTLFFFSGSNLLDFPSDTSIEMQYLRDYIQLFYLMKGDVFVSNLVVTDSAFPPNTISIDNTVSVVNSSEVAASFAPRVFCLPSFMKIINNIGLIGTVIPICQTQSLSLYNSLTMLSQVNTTFASEAPGTDAGIQTKCNLVKYEVLGKQNINIAQYSQLGNVNSPVNVDNLKTSLTFLSNDDVPTILFFSGRLDRSSILTVLRDFPNFSINPNEELLSQVTMNSSNEIRLEGRNFIITKGLSTSVSIVPVCTVLDKVKYNSPQNNLLVVQLNNIFVSDSTFNSKINDKNLSQVSLSVFNTLNR